MTFAFIFEELRQEFLKPEPDFNVILIWLVKSRTKLDKKILILPFIVHEMYCKKTKFFLNREKTIENISFYFSNSLEMLLKKNSSDFDIVFALALKYLEHGNKLKAIEFLKRVASSTYPYRALAEQYLNKILCEDK